MAGRVPFSEINEASQDPSSGTLSGSYELFPGASELEYVGSIPPVTRNWSELSGCNPELNFHGQLQERYKFSVEQCLTELENVKRKKETTFIQVKKAIRNKVDTMVKAVRQSFETMHNEGTKKLEQKCEEIGRVLARVEKLIEEGNQDIPLNDNREISIYSQTFYNAMLKEKQRIEEEVEALIQQLNIKRESDEQLYMEFKEDVQQKVQAGISRMENSLEVQAEYHTRAVQEKITELRRALANLQHLSKFS